MLRTVFCSLAVLAFLVSGLARAEDVKKEGNVHKHKAWYVKAEKKGDVTYITFKVKLKNGKEKEETLPVAPDAKVRGESGKFEKLSTFEKAEANEKDKAILIVEDKEKKHITEIDDLK